MKSVYQVNFSDYINFSYNNVICDTNEIINICNINYTIYPEILKYKMKEILNNKCVFTFSMPAYNYEGVILDLPNEKRKEDIIIFSRCGGGNGYELFKELKINLNLKNECKARYNLLIKPYLSIQIRNTDYKCDYETLYIVFKISNETKVFLKFRIL